ncbi:MAG: hypothetical protein ICV79_10250, partial [Flavisolibacter sp.]|nr:hypothetical protein [Flavisolibacter sp.]
LKAEGNEENNSSTEFYSPATNTFSPGPPMSTKRAGHTATLLNDGNILITGGFNNEGFLRTAEIFNVRSGEFEIVNGLLSEPRAAHTATLLNDGRVVLVGGVNGGLKANQLIDMYDPATNTISKISSLITARTGHTATLLNNGRLLIAGGSENWRSNVLNTCELFDPVANTVSQTASLQLIRNKHAAVKLQDDKVLIIAGSNDAERIGGRYRTCELFDPKTYNFQLLKNKLADSRFKITNAADVLPNGNVIIAGDGRYVEIFDAPTQTFHTANGSVGEAWMYPTVTTLKDGNVLITGGYNSSMEPTNKAWVYRLK